MIAGVRTWVSWLLIMLFHQMRVPVASAVEDPCTAVESAALGEHGGFGYSRLFPGCGGGQLGEGRVYLSTGSLRSMCCSLAGGVFG